MHEQALVGSRSERAKVTGGRVMGPIEERGILGSQDERERAQAGIGGLNVRGENVRGVDGVGVEEAIGGFEHGGVVGSLRQGSRGLSSEGGGKLDEAFGASSIAEVGVSKLGGSP
jgi:hypothetical protein